MPTITSLGKNKKKVAVYLDNNFFCFLTPFTIFKYKLAENQEISQEKLKEIQIESEFNIAFDLALNYITKYQKTEKETKDYLFSKGFVPELCDKVVERLKEYHYLDDFSFAQSYISMNQNKYGKNKIKLLLKQKGIDEEIIKNLDISADQEALVALALRYLRNKERTFENRQKCARHLFSKGFLYEDINKALNQIFKGDTDESWE